MSLRDLTPRPPVTPTLTLVLLHHAGGSAGNFLPFVPHLPTDWRILAADLPGRLFDPKERACRDSEEAVEYLLSTLTPELDGPYAVFGHSMGALLGYELVRVLESRGDGPRWLGVSGFPAPRTVGVAGNVRERERRDTWPARRLLQFSHGLGGIPTTNSRRGRPGRAGDRFDRRFADRIDERICERVVRTLRNDLAIIDGYEHTLGPPIRTALSVFRSDADPMAPIGLTHQWADHAADLVAFHTWPGGHFYLFDRAAEVCAQVIRTCRSLLDREARPDEEAPASLPRLAGRW
jgi:surfactin synthase thioesterase subunit